MEDNGFRARAILTGISAGTERMWFEGTNPALVSGRRGYPYFPGYEFVGEITEVGSAAEGARVGDRVFAMKPHASEVTLGPDDYWTRLPDALSSEDALGIALTATNLHALHRVRLQAGDVAVVVGLGTLGFLCCQVLRASGAGTVVAISRSERKRSLALELGADGAFAPGDSDLVERVGALTGGRGADVAFECAGVSSAVDTALACVRSQGHVVVAGFHVEPFSVSGERFFSKEVTLHSVRASGSTQPTGEFVRWSRRENLAAAARLVAAGRVLTEPLITHRIPAPDLKQAYEVVTTTESGYIQVVLDWRNPVR